MFIILQTILHINSIPETTCQDLSQTLKGLLSSLIELWEDQWVAQSVGPDPMAQVILTAN
jgi:hypothetical protein